MYINTYWCKAMNCEQTTKKTKKSIANEIDTKEAQEADEVEEEASKQARRRQTGGQAGANKAKVSLFILSGG